MSTANDSTRVEVAASELPIHCPAPNAPLWTSHPRVYIPLEDSPDGVATCSYCGTEFVLAGKQTAAAD